jgi:hypothetical protein
LSVGDPSTIQQLASCRRFASLPPLSAPSILPPETSLLRWQSRLRFSSTTQSPGLNLPRPCRLLRTHAMIGQSCIKSTLLILASAGVGSHLCQTETRRPSLYRRRLRGEDTLASSLPCVPCRSSKYSPLRGHTICLPTIAHIWLRSGRARPNVLGCGEGDTAGCTWVQERCMTRVRDRGEKRMEEDEGWAAGSWGILYAV